MSDDVKFCRYCKEEKYLSCFSIFNKALGRRRNKCKECRNTAGREYYKVRGRLLKERKSPYKPLKEKVATQCMVSYRKEYYKNNKDKFNNRQAARRAAKINATPLWSESDKIKIIYKKAKELSNLTGLNYHVDHIIPLNSDVVCGLHVWNNLQILEDSLNCAKGNKV